MDWLGSGNLAKDIPDMKIGPLIIASLSVPTSLSYLEPCLTV